MISKVHSIPKQINYNLPMSWSIRLMQCATTIYRNQTKGSSICSTIVYSSQNIDFNNPQ